jgi:hypothetical protein
MPSTDATRSKQSEILTNQTGLAIDAKSNSVAIPENCRPAAERLYQFAQIVPLYGFDPQITGVRPETSRYRKDWLSVVVQTRSHVAQVINGKLVSVNSLYDGSDTRRRPEAVNEWYKGTGTLSKEDAVQMTLDLLKKLGEVGKADELKGGREEFHAEPVTVKTSEGENVRVVPFRTLWLYDSNGTGRLELEFRIGPMGSLGITKWFSP